MRTAGLIVLVAVLAAGAFFGWPVLRGYLGARQETVPPVQTMDKPAPPAGSTKGTGQKNIGQMEFPVLPKGQNTSPVPPAGTVEKQAGAGEGQTRESQTGESQTGESQTGESQTGESQTGESQIDVDYLARLSQIGQYYQGQLDSLVSQAYSSYLAVKAGKSNASLLSLAGQYIEKGQALESQSDQQFNGVLEQYREALEKAGEPLTYEERAKADYEAAKAAERQRILSAAEQYLK